MEFSLARQRFYQEIQQADATINLAAAALYIAQEAYPDLDPEVYLNALDVMASEASERMPAEPYPLKIIQALNCYLFEDLKFSGNSLDYYNPRNSFLNDVIDNRMGIPITLSLVYLEIAKRLDFPMAGVGMPGHFLIRPLVEDMTVLVDPFHQGEVMFEEDCQTRLQQIFGGAVQLQPQFLEPIQSKQFLVRMLTNLKMLYIKREEIPQALAAIERILLLFPDNARELRDRGLLYFHTGRLIEARQDLESYLNVQPAGEDAPQILRILQQIEDWRGN
ncbi:MAG: tetratricopeptide repeat protein [Leptolyngbyaceae cyanobacterium MO_188.B28]|nr:tetratricopeptide repeat protein [Leptolyngbyaceae cyanobacterium MO_188.B28]